MFNFAIILTALTIAAVAAFFSVSGLGKLFAGSVIPVIIMASALETGKLMTAAFVTRKWKQLTFILKVYYSFATLMLVLITSMGIYGFLTAAYQTTSDELSILDRQTSVLESKKQNYQDQLDLYVQDRESLNDRVNELTRGLSNNVIQYRDTVTNEIITTTSVNTRNALQRQLDDAREQRTEAVNKISEFSDSILSIDNQILSLQVNNDLSREVGPLRYISNITGWEMDKVVNVIALLIVFVFDPLAVVLVIGYNYIKTTEENEQKLYKIYNEIKNNKTTKEQDIIEENDEMEQENDEESLEKIDEGGLDKPSPNVLNLEEENKNQPDIGTGDSKGPGGLARLLRRR